MLHAILFNKAGRSLTNNEVHWRKHFTASEDSLTSTIFGNLFHLPVELFWKILNDSCYTEKLTNENYRIVSVEFWPHWASQESSNINYIEPDIFIRTTGFDLVIEAKRFDYSQHSIAQWTAKYQGYLNEYGDEQKRVILLAIGGIENEQPESIELAGKNLKILKCRWVKLLDAVKRAQEQLSKSQYQLNSIDSTLVILNDTIMGFGIHGYATGKWFEDEDFSRLTHLSSYGALSSFVFQKKIIL